MIIVMKADVRADSDEVRQIVDLAQSYPEVHTELHEIQGSTRSLLELYLLGSTGVIPTMPFEEFACVEKVVRITEKFRSIGRHEGRLEAVGFEYNGVHLGQDSLHLFPGLCAVDDRKNVATMFESLANLGIVTARAGAYKPRTSPYDFQGLEASCLPWVFELAGEYGIKIVSMEVTHESHLEEIQHALEESGQATGVMLQIGTRNAQNFILLEEVGKMGKPVLLKRGLASQIEDWLLAAEYILATGNQNVILCERGIRTFETATRNTVDINAIPLVKQMSHLPLIADPSHGTGKWSLVLPVARAAIAAGADGVMVEVHPNPDHALSDGAQSLNFQRFRELMEQSQVVGQAVGHPLWSAATEPTPA